MDIAPPPQKKLGRGVQFEWAIIFNALQKINHPNLPNRQEVSPKLKSYSANISKLALNAVSKLEENNVNLFDLCHSDEQNIFGNPEPKTDIISDNYKISVKLPGSVQLCSVQGRTFAKMLSGAAEKNNLKGHEKLSKLVSDIEVLEARFIAEKNKTKATNRKPELVKTMIVEDKILEKYNWDLQRDKNKVIETEVNEILKELPQLYDELIYEALSGEDTFKDNPLATANYILTPDEFKEINRDYVQSIKPRLNVGVRAKSRAGISTVAFRLCYN